MQRRRRVLNLFMADLHNLNAFAPTFSHQLFLSLFICSLLCTLAIVGNERDQVISKNSQRSTLGCYGRCHRLLFWKWSSRLSIVWHSSGKAMQGLNTLKNDDTRHLLACRSVCPMPHEEWVLYCIACAHFRTSGECINLEWDDYSHDERTQSFKQLARWWPNDACACGCRNKAKQ